MHTFYRIVLALNWIVALLWLLRVLTWRRGLDRVADLTRDDAESPNAVPLPSLTVVVPARNEGDKIAATLQSLLRSEQVTLEIIAVDDRSDDQTGTVMDTMAAQAAVAERGVLTALHVSELPTGWLGKTHAMALAARHATGEWLLFTDGDVLFRPDALRRALTYAVASHADHLVLLPTLLIESWGERMMTAFLQVMTLWAVRMWKLPDPKARRDVIGVGAFNLIRREVYDAIGGWEALRMEVVEDLALGIAVKRHGYAQRAALGRDLVSVRWLEGLFGVVDNLAKNLFAFFHYRAELLLAFLPLFALSTLFPLAAAFAGAASALATAVMLLAVGLAYQRQGRYQHFGPGQMVFFPAASLLMLYTMVRSMAVVLWKGGITWRGTFYPLSELRAQRNSRNA